MDNFARTERPPCKPGVYTITDPQTGTFYAGSSSNLNGRYSSHKGKLAKGIHDNPVMRALGKSMDELRFEFIVTETVDEARDREQSLLDSYVGTPHCANIGTGARGVWSGGMPEEIHKSFTATSKTRANSPEAQARLADYNATRVFTDEERQAISDRMRGVKPSEETRRKMSEAHKGKVFSDDTRAKMSLASRSRECFSPDAREKQKTACSKPVSIQGTTYPSAEAAARALGMGASTVVYRVKASSFSDWLYV